MLASRFKLIHAAGVARLRWKQPFAETGRPAGFGKNTRLKCRDLCKSSAFLTEKRGRRPLRNSRGKLPIKILTSVNRSEAQPNGAVPHCE